MRKKLNVAVVGGGLCTLIPLGGYSVIWMIMEPDSYSGDSMGAIVIISLAIGKTPLEIERFLAKNALSFCLPVIGKEIMRSKLDEFWNGIKFADLPVECNVSIALTPPKEFMRTIIPYVVTRENAGERKAADIAVDSSTVPGLYLPNQLIVDGKKYLALDGGLALNPPLIPDAKNILFSYENPSSLKENSWNKRARFPQNEKADLLFNPYTEQFGMLGGAKKVCDAFEFGRQAMQKEKTQFLEKLGL